MADPRVQGIVEFILKEKGLLDASTRLRQLEAQVKQTQGTMVNLGQAGAALGTALRTYVAPLAIFNFFRTSALDMLQFQKQLAGTAQTIRALGGDASKEMPRVEAFLGAIQDATGIIDDETLPAFQKLLGITESVPAALEGVALAARVARSGAMEFGEAAQAITSVLQGKLTGAASQLGIALKDANGEARDAADVFRDLGERLDKLDLEKQATGVKGLRGAWDKFSDAVGTVFIPTLNVASRTLEAFLNVGTLLFKVIEGGALAFANLALQIASVGTGIYGLVTGKGLEGFSKFGDATSELHQQLLDLFSGTEQVDKGLANTTKGLEDAATRIRGLDGGKDVKDRLAAEKALIDSKIALAEEGSRRRLDLELQAMEVERAEKVKAAGKDLDQIAAIYETYDNKRRKLEQDYTKFQSDEAKKQSAEQQKAVRAADQAQLDVLRSRRDLVAEGTAERLGLTLQVIEKEMDIELEGTERTEREKAAIRERYANVRLGAERDFLEVIYKQLMDGLEKEAEILEDRRQAAEKAQIEISDMRKEDAERALDELMKYGELMTAERSAQALAAVEQVQAIEEEAALEEYRTALGRAISRGETTTAITLRYLKRVEDASRASANARNRIEQQVALTQIYWARYAAQMFTLVGGMVFGENKKFKAAMALIDGILAGMESFWMLGGPAGAPASYAALALGIVTGIAQAAAIMKAQPGDVSAGGGGGGGGGGGRGGGGAGVVAPEKAPTGRVATTGSASAGTSAQQTTVIHDNSTGQVIHVHGSFIDSDSLRGLSRRLAQTNRDDQARFQR